MGRLESRADVVLDPLAVEAMLFAVEDGLRSVLLNGRRVSDDAGDYFEITGDGDPVGVAVVCECGGTEPDEAVEKPFLESFPEGVLSVVDPYAGEFALYVSEGGILRSATAVIRE